MWLLCFYQKWEIIPGGYLTCVICHLTFDIWQLMIIIASSSSNSCNSDCLWPLFNWTSESEVLVAGETSVQPCFPSVFNVVSFPNIYSSAENCQKSAELKRCIHIVGMILVDSSPLTIPNTAVRGPILGTAYCAHSLLSWQQKTSQ